MTEVEAGKMAQEKGASQDVKDFGAMMVKDHSQNDDDLMALAQTKGVTVPTKLDTMHQEMIDSLNSMSGAAFDKAYITDMVKGHKKMLALMKSEESSKDSDMKDFRHQDLGHRADAPEQGRGDPDEHEITAALLSLKPGAGSVPPPGFFFFSSKRPRAILRPTLWFPAHEPHRSPPVAPRSSSAAARPDPAVLPHPGSGPDHRRGGRRSLGHRHLLHRRVRSSAPRCCGRRCSPSR